MSKNYDNNWFITKSEGNPGALNALIRISMNTFGLHMKIFQHIDRLQSLKGTNIYILYSDICKNDVNLMLYLLDNMKDDDLEKAYSVQDRSGVKICQPFIDKYKAQFK